MLGYIYTTEIQAENAVYQCDNHYGYPKENCITNHWCNYKFSNLDNFYYIIYDESLEVILGEPIEITLTEIIQ
jgi:hypothetical protein